MDMPGIADDETDFLEDYKAIFDFLTEKRVNRIFKIVVNDLIGPPHRDSSIVSLTKRFKVEHWKWK
jgi:hypothetical protein